MSIIAWRRNWWKVLLVVISLMTFFLFFLVKSKLILNILEPRIVKSFSTPSGTAFQYNSPTISDEYIYIGTSNWVNYPEPEKLLKEFQQNYIYKLDLDFNKIWEYALAPAELTNGAVALDSQGNLYFVTGTYSVDLGQRDKSQGKSGIFIANFLYSLTNQGKFRWKKQISYNGQAWIHGMYNVAVSKNDRIYVSDSKFFAFNMNGDQLWQYPDSEKLITGNLSAPIIDSLGNVYFTAPEANTQKQESDTIKAYKFAANSRGIPLWETLLGNEVFVTAKGDGGGYKDRWNLSTPAFTTDKKILYAAVGNTMNAVDTATGKLIWSYVPEGMTGTFKASPVVDTENNIYIGTKDNEASVLYAIRADGSGLLWKNPVGVDLYSSPLLGDDYTLYVGSEYTGRGNFHAVEMQTGKIKWSITDKLLEDHSFGSPALYNGYIYTGTHKQNFSGSLFKIKTTSQNYLQGAAWPKFHGGNANSGRRE